MATLNELGRNSASITYGTYATGQDIFPTLQAVDTWFRNDTWQGTATASGTALSGVSNGALWSTQARAGDYIIVAGQQRIVQSVGGDNSITVTQAFSPAITIPSTVRVVGGGAPFITTQTAGYISLFVRGETNGTVSTTVGSTTITGVNTYFLADATNSTATVSVNGSVAIAVDGTITGTGTTFSASQGQNNGLYPGDDIAVTTNGAIYYFTIATVASDTSATVTVPPTVAISGTTTIVKATNGIIGRSIQINGRMRTITAIASNTSMTVNLAMDFTDSNMRYKVYPRGTLSNSSSAGGTLYGTTSATSTNSTTLTIGATITGQLMPGMLIYGLIGTIPANTVITSQQYGSGASINFTTSGSATTTATNVLTMSTATLTGVTVGMLVQSGANAAFTYGPASTYVVAINGTSVTLSQNTTSSIPGGTAIYFIAPGTAGVYTTNNNTTLGGVQIYFSTLQATGANLFWDLGVNNLISTTNTPYMYQASALDQIWIGDEVRTVNFNSFNGAPMANASVYLYTTDYVGFSGTAVGAIRQGVYLIPYKREDSYINGNVYGTTTAFLNDLRVGDDLIIDGTEVTVTQLISNTQFKIDKSFTHSTANNSGGAATASTTAASGGAVAATTFVVTSATGIVIGQLITGVGLPQGTYVTNLASTTVTVNNPFTNTASGTYNFYNGTSFYKKLKLHGYSLEGTREGGPGISTTSAGAVAANAVIASATAAGTTVSVITVTSGIILPGMQVLPPTTGASSTVVTGLCYVVNQLFGTGTASTATLSGTSGTNILTTSTIPSPAFSVGQIVCGLGAAIAGIPASTYIIAITGSGSSQTLYLSNNLTATFTNVTTINAYTAGITGTYTVSSTVTVTTAALNFFAPLTGKYTNATTMLGTNGTAYPVGTSTITAASIPWVGQYNFVKIAGGGGPPLVLSGQVTFASSFVYGVNTLFTSQLHIGAEIVIAGQYLTVVAIASDTVLNVRESAGTTPVVYLTPFYRTVPLYTYALSTSSSTINLATPIKENLYTNSSNPPQIYFTGSGGDFLEYVYSAPNFKAQSGTTALLNTSLDRKYVGFRIFPLFQSTNSTPTATFTISTAFGAYATPVYERWAAGYAQTHGVGINQADLSGGTLIWAYQNATTLNITMPISGSLNLQMGIQGQTTGNVGYPQTLGASVAGVAMGMPNNTITSVSSSQSLGTNNNPAVFAGSLYGVYDITAMTQISGGTLFLFADRRYLAIQGRSASNIQTQWLGCIEFERAQPEDASTGLGTSTGVVFGGTSYGGVQLAQGSSSPTTTTPGFNQSIQFISGTAPWPCFAYFNGNRMPTGSQQIPTVPNLGTTGYPVHGCVLACPRVRNSAGDLVGFNAHIYSALTVTTGRWGHMLEMGNYGTYTPAYTTASAGPTVTTNVLINIANTVPQIHMGQIIPVYTNVYNAKRFMFSPVVVLGPAYDPDVRGRIFGLKVLPSALGTLMDTVSITVDNSYFYDTSFQPSDHWVLTTPPTTSYNTAYPGQQTVVTSRFTLTANTPAIQQSWRSLEDTAAQATTTATAPQFTNNFRFALPA